MKNKQNIYNFKTHSQVTTKHTNNSFSLSFILMLQSCFCCHGNPRPDNFLSTLLFLLLLTDKERSGASLCLHHTDNNNNKLYYTALLNKRMKCSKTKINDVVLRTRRFTDELPVHQPAESCDSSISMISNLRCQTVFESTSSSFQSVMKTSAW